MSQELDNKIKIVSEKYRDLKKCQSTTKQAVLVFEIKVLCQKINKLLDKEKPNAQTFRRKKQIDDITNKLQEVQIKKEEMQHLNLNYKEKSSNKMNRDELSKRVARTILFEEVRSTQIKISPQELEKIAVRMEKNQEVMKEIDMMIKEQGEDLDIIESNIKHTYEKVKEANGELDEADKIQTKNRLLKIKLGVTGLFAGLGGAILGIPGMVVGLFTAFKVTK